MLVFEIRLLSIINFNYSIVKQTYMMLLAIWVLKFEALYAWLGKEGVGGLGLFDLVYYATGVVVVQCSTSKENLKVYVWWERGC